MKEKKETYIMKEKDGEKITKLVLIKNGVKTDSKIVPVEKLKELVDITKMFKKFIHNGVEVAVDEELWNKFL